MADTINEQEEYAPDVLEEGDYSSDDADNYNPEFDFNEDDFNRMQEEGFDDDNIDAFFDDGDGE